MKSNHNFSESEMAFVTKAEQYCASSEQCRSAVRDKLLTWGAGQELRERIVDYLTENDFINEERFCRIYCESKLHLQKWGRVKIAYQLRSKRIDNATINKALQGIDEEVYHQTLTNLTVNKNNSIVEPDNKKRRAKLMSFLSSHGFTIEEIESAVAALGL
ncbi:MAG: RecX family transcriptional regulator [Bacteroidales bacterium]|nr:RecX family transcriptional regulator [Bacteroidales bacterium]